MYVHTMFGIRIPVVCTFMYCCQFLLVLVIAVHYVYAGKVLYKVGVSTTRCVDMPFWYMYT